ncbi:hypothetical protein SLEP1_g53277 [Rubroshorea leprosula]|uniref:Reverse transcriptase domain-containing protein n=1 Tax=Rubroshorea leprosula TaxID=152421 RepID=A0AAV5M8X7_9ROSI|nr:hypothetical protein SLEP1_g53277 [Rubroshorea leprosula]
MRPLGQIAASNGGKVPGDGFQVVDVFLPNKRDKWGNRFGFVRMVGVQNEEQMVKKLNEIWFGQYKLRVKRADHGSGFPRRRRYQAVVGKSKWVEKQQPQGMIATKKVSVKRHEGRDIEQRVLGAENEGEGSGEKEKVQEKSMGVDKECIIAFEPTKEENQWLEGGMVAVLISLMSVTGIQERMDVDGGLLALFPLGGSFVLLLEKVKGYLGEYMVQNRELFDTWFESILPWALVLARSSRLVWLRISSIPLNAWTDRCFEMIGRTFGEVVKVHEDTKSKAVLCERRLHEIQVMEEGWRSDPDWWLSEGDRRSTTGALLEYSSTHIDSEDQRFIDDEILGEDEDNIELELLQENGILNSKSKQIDGESLTGGDGGYDHCNENGLRSANGRLKDYRGLNDNELVEVNGPREDDVESSFNKMSKDSKQKGHHNEKAEWVTGRTKQRRLRREKAKSVPVGSSKPEQQGEGESLSNGCIAHQNQVIQWEINMQEVLSFNVRGLGSMAKRRELGKLVRVEKPNLLFLQETKLEGVEEGLCKKLWYSDDFDWNMKSSVGASGGLICVWDKSSFVKLGEFTGDGYLGIKGQWGVKKEVCFFVNIYAPNERKKKAVLWDELRQRIVEEGGWWMLAGDFNAVRCMDKRRGKIGESVDMKDFDLFIETAGLVDSKLINLFIETAGLVDSKLINLFIETAGLVDSKLINRKFTWYRPDGTAMSRLDKILMTVEMSRQQIRDPNRFEYWMHGNIIRNLEKLLKTNGMNWLWMDLQFQHAVSTVAKLDMKNEEVALEEEELEERRQGFQALWDIMRKRESIWKQKSRSNWAKWGDANSRYFHKIVNERKAHNNIVGISCDGRWIEEPEVIKREVVGYFRRAFANDSRNRPKPTGIGFKRIFEEMTAWLERPFSMEEIEEGLKSCEGTKAPGSDGYNFSFIKYAWECMKEDFVRFFEEFHQNGRLVKGLNSSFLTLIPKKMNPMELKDFRPISLVGCVYKLLAKVLANRLRVVMSESISDTQSAFLGGRQLVDSVLVLNEVVDEVKQRTQQAFIFKADFEKAYDCVDWSYLDWMMSRFGFGGKWRGWIRECFSTARVSVLVNGSPTEEFAMGKGLRQGDPLSPFLFLMVAEGLHGLVKKAEEEGLLQGITVGNNGLAISLLQFADDIVILGKANSESIFMVKTILRWCELMSGLRINFGKSSVFGFNVSHWWIKGAASALHCGVGETPFMYLGMPVGGKSGSKKMWDLVLNKFQAKLVVWKSAVLSVGGCITLLNSVVWERYYGGREEVDITAVDTVRVSRLWRDVMSIGLRSDGLKNMLVKGFRWGVGDGSRVDFWKAVWVGEKTLRDLCPRLFQLAIHKDGLVSEMGVWEEGSWRWKIDWRRGRRGREKDEEVLRIVGSGCMFLMASLW